MPVDSSSNSCSLVGTSPALHSIKEIAASVASRRSTILILGQTGTGKELLARYIHNTSSRSEAPFVPVDCSTLTETLFESQLFGHVRGAFTGAVRDNVGFIRAADGGTLFLDEIGELPLVMQAKLLRVLQERAVVAVGSTRPQPVDTRVIGATNRDLAAMVRKGAFREDLYFRLNVISILLPPLHERVTDVLPLASHFLRQQAAMYDETVKQLTAEAADALQAYSWPGNVRELANVIEHAHVLTAGDLIGKSDLPKRVYVDSIVQSRRGTTLIDLERQAILSALEQTAHNKSAAARMLGLNIQRLNRRIRKLSMHGNQAD